ncbi:MAG: TRAP transporter small permease [Pseudomonadota bacterium]|nr:TRAP transporter small permease [Pseudomonadota bacterium]
MNTPRKHDTQTGSRLPGPASPTRYFGYLVNVSAVIGTALIAVVMFVLNADIVSRALFSRALPGVREIVTASLALIVFLQLSSALRKGRMVRTDGIVPVLKSRAPVAARVLETVQLLIGVGMFTVLSYATWRLFLSAYASNDQFGVPGGFSFAKWPVQAVVFFGCVMMALQYLTLAVGTAMGRGAEPRDQEGEGGLH